MPFLSTVSDVATAATFLVGSAPEALAWLRDTFQGTDLQEPAHVAAFALKALIDYQHLFTDVETIELMRIYIILKKGIIKVMREEKLQAQDPGVSNATKVAKERVFRSAFKSFVRIFKTTKAAELLNQPSQIMQELIRLAAEGKMRTLDLSEKAQLRAVYKARVAQAERDGDANTLFGPGCEFSDSKISLLYEYDGPLPAWHPDSLTQLPWIATAPTQSPRATVATPTPPSIETAGGDPFASSIDHDMDAESAYQLDDLRPSSPCTIASTCASTSDPEEPMPTAH